MAHIAACMLDSDGDSSSLRSYIANPFSAQASTDSLVSTGSAEEKKPQTWRMHHPEARKYQLFPKEKQLPPVTTGKQLELEQAYVMALGQSPEKSDKALLSSGLRMRIKEHNLTRRRKVSVPDLGPMTTVQEAAMDSPTIPGRPALHERSISSPANPLRQHHLADLVTNAKGSIEETPAGMHSRGPNAQKMTGSPLRIPLSPKDLAPLTIPNQSGTIPRLARQLSLSRLRPSNSQLDLSTKSARTDESPLIRTPYTPFSPPSSSTLNTPKSATTVATASTMPTPMSAPSDFRMSPKPWERTGLNTPVTSTQPSEVDPMSTPRAGTDREPQSQSSMSHKRGPSDSGSIMERGRPRKRSDGTPIGAGHSRTASASKRSISAERRAFEELPRGWKSSDAVKNLEQAEVSYLQKQALGQALRFEVLKKEDVENLSKELRHLDERCEYLHRTYISLRAGRRNLHTRICQYLRSPRVAKFSYESMLKQEEALAELDSSIDDWVSKLEHAENRRTRVRQKLLEHVAAAATLPFATDAVGTSESLQKVMGIRDAPGAPETSTPPRSPIKSAPSFHVHCSSPSPQRVVARVPSVIPELPAEENIEDTQNHPTHLGSSLNGSERQSALQRMESIRIYADSDVYALLADVENEFTKLNGDDMNPEVPSRPSTDVQRRELHRAQSRDALTGAALSVSRNVSKTPPASPPAPSPPSKCSTNDEDIFLSATVFQPTHTTISA